MSAFLISIYIAAMATANLLVWWLGPWFSPINSFFLIGLDLTLRDVMHERLTRLALAGVVLAGGALTFALNPSASQIALASAIAFIVAALVDWAIYSALFARGWMLRSNGSNVAGAAVDSILFPTIAFGIFLPGVIALQFLAKVGGGALWSLFMQPLIGRRAA